MRKHIYVHFNYGKEDRRRRRFHFLRLEYTNLFSYSLRRFQNKVSKFYGISNKRPLLNIQSKRNGSECFCMNKWIRSYRWNYRRLSEYVQHTMHGYSFLINFDPFLTHPTKNNLSTNVHQNLVTLQLDETTCMKWALGTNKPNLPPRAMHERDALQAKRKSSKWIDLNSKRNNIINAATPQRQ